MMDDPAELSLRFDPVAVAIQGSRDAELLEKLDKFAADLTRYLALVRPQQITAVAVTGNEIVVEAEAQQRLAAIVPVVRQKLEREPVVDALIPSSPLVDRRAPARLKSISDSSSNEEDCVFGKCKKRRRAIINGQSKKDTGNHKQEKHRLAGVNGCPKQEQEKRSNLPLVVKRENVYSTEEGSRKKKSHRSSASEHCSDLKDIEEEKMSPLTAVKRDTSEANEEDAEQEQKARHFANCVGSEDDEVSKKGNETVAHAAISPAACTAVAPQQPRILTPEYSGKLAGSKLQRAVGRTRKEMNQYLPELGLSARFGMTLISKMSNVVSHPSLSQTWNDLPETNGENLQLWLGQSAGRLALVSDLNPFTRRQAQEGIPIFWARAARKKGGDLCHYIGHFRSFNFVTSDVVFKGKQRQALIEFQFVKFCTNMATFVAKIPSVG